MSGLYYTYLLYRFYNNGSTKVNFKMPRAPLFPYTILLQVPNCADPRRSNSQFLAGASASLKTFCCRNPLVIASSSSSVNAAPPPKSALNGSPASNRSSRCPSSVTRLHSVVSKKPLLVARLLAKRIVPVCLLPRTVNQMSMRPCSWFISPWIQGIWCLK